MVLLLRYLPSRQHDSLAAALHFANATKGIDGAIKVLVDATELGTDVTTLAEAVVNGTTTDVGNDIGKLLADWSSITGGCKSDDSACAVIDGLLRLVQAVASDVAPCEATLSPAIADLTAAVTAWEGKNYTAAVGDFATALDVIANALTQDSCGLSKIADAISSISPKLKAAVVKIESSGAVHIIVESADIYESLYTLVRSIQRGDWTSAGEAMGA